MMMVMASVRAVVLVAVVPPLAVLLAVAVGRAAARGVKALARAQFAPLLMHGVPGAASTALRRRNKHGGRKAAPEHEREHELQVALYRRRKEEEEEEAPAVECAFCLSGVEEGDEVRELRCRHLFHRGCLDRWLVAHPTCPLCRSRLLSAPAPARWDDDDSESESESDMVLLMAYVSSGSSSWFWSPSPSPSPST